MYAEPFFIYLIRCMLNLIRYALNFEIQHYFNTKYINIPQACCGFGTSCGCGDKEDRLKLTGQNVSISSKAHRSQEGVHFLYQLLQPFYTSQPSYINLSTPHLKNIIHPRASNIFKEHLTTFPPFTICLFLLLRKIFLVMSGLVDMCTREMAKLREKGRTMFSNGSSLTNAESSQRVQAKDKEESSTGLFPAFSRFMRVSSPVVSYSEASVSMLECLCA